MRGRAGILFQAAEAAMGKPERKVIFPAAGEQTFDALAAGRADPRHAPDCQYGPTRRRHHAGALQRDTRLS